MIFSILRKSSCNAWTAGEVCTELEMLNVIGAAEFGLLRGHTACVSCRMKMPISR